MLQQDFWTVCSILAPKCAFVFAALGVARRGRAVAYWKSRAEANKKWRICDARTSTLCERLYNDNKNR